MSVSGLAYAVASGAVGCGAGAVVGSVGMMAGVGCGAFLGELFGSKSNKGVLTGAYVAGALLARTIESSTPFFWAMRNVSLAPSLMAAAHYTNQLCNSTKAEKHGKPSWCSRGWAAAQLTTTALSLCTPATPMVSLSVGWLVGMGSVRYARQIDKIHEALRARFGMT